MSGWCPGLLSDAAPSWPLAQAGGWAPGTLGQAVLGTLTQPLNMQCLAHKHMRTTLRTLCLAGAHPSLPDAKVSLCVYLSLSLQAGHALGWCKFTLGACASVQTFESTLGLWRWFIRWEHAECVAHTNPCWLQDAQQTPSMPPYTACSAHASP